MMDSWSEKAVKGVDIKDNRLLIARLRGDPKNFNIIVVYLPTSAHENQDLNKVYELIEEIVDNTPSKTSQVRFCV